jgi:hypothetical protein
LDTNQFTCSSRQSVKAPPVQQLAARLGISLVYIPSYSPNLNLIERFWKFAKAKLRTKYYDDFVLFRHTIDSILDSSDKLCKSAIDSLIGDKLQLFDDLASASDLSFYHASDSSSAISAAA